MAVCVKFGMENTRIIPSDKSGPYTEEILLKEISEDVVSVNIGRDQMNWKEFLVIVITFQYATKTRIFSCRLDINKCYKPMV
jgi:hypothetical protein